MRSASNRERLETAFTVAEQDLGISRLLDPEVRVLAQGLPVPVSGWRV